MLAHEPVLAGWRGWRDDPATPVAADDDPAAAAPPDDDDPPKHWLCPVQCQNKES